VYQILRGSIIAFTALFGYVFLKKKVAPVKIFGICVVFAGLAIVGTSAYLASQESNASDQTASSSLVIIGFALVVVGQAFNALQFTVQEVLIERDGVDALSIVGWEGLYGTLMSSFILLPIVQAIPGSDAGSVENSLDTMVMLRNSAALLALNMFVYPIIIALLNGFALLITEHMSALYRCLIDASRVLLVWLVGLLIFYGGSEKYGESWTPYSWMQLGGFVVFFSGMLVYREVIPPVNRFFARLAQKSHMTSLQ
jgi:drug/metabolite transporter (DMT)-like permease